MKIKLTLLLLIVVNSLFAQTKDSTLIIGKLDNGLTYYIKKNDMTKGKVDFYLLQNVGSMMESDDQNGLAHFLEHMAFNGTENFPNGIQSFLNKYGVTSFNASTGFDETVYYINNVPSDKKTLVDSCVLILRDWSAYISLNPSEINRERGVILEERRTTRDVGTSVRDISNKVIYNGSKYATHDIIGTVDVLENFTPEALRRYYKDFYRPDLQAVIIVGDINPSDIEAKVKELFTPIPKRTNPLPREVIVIPDNEEPMYSKAIVKEVGGTAVTLMKRIKKEQITSLEQLIRENIIRSFYSKMINARLKIYAEENNPSFSLAMVQYSTLVRGYDTFNVMIKPYSGKDRAAFEEMITEVERIHRFGFTKEELEEQREAFLQKIDAGLKGSHLLPNKSYVAIYQNNFLLSNPITTVAEDLAASEKIVRSLSVDDIKTWVDSWYNKTNNTIYLIDGATEDYDYPTLEELVKITSDVKAKKLESISYNIDIPQLVDFEINGGSVVKSKKMNVLDMEKWTLSNGATVYYKKSTAERGKVSFFGESYGGKSLISAKDLPSAAPINVLALYSGIHKHTGRQLRECLKNKSISISLNLSETAESMNGMCDIKNVEDFFAMFYMIFEKPRFDEAIFNKYCYQQKLALSEYQKTPFDDVKREMSELLLKDSPRRWVANEAYYDAMNFDTMVKIYKERFSNASDFTFYLSGDISSDDAKRLVAKYIAAIPSTGNKEKFVNHDIVKRQSITKDFAIEMAEPKYVIDIEYTNYNELSRKEEIMFSALGFILQNRYNAQIREEEGGTYSVQVETSTSTFPIHKQSLRVGFETSMDKGEYLRILVHKQLESIQKIGIEQEELEDFVLIMKRKRGEMKTSTNSQFWIEAMRNYIDQNQDITSDKYFETIIDKIKISDIQAFLNKFIKNVQLTDIVILSKN